MSVPEPALTIPEAELRFSCFRASGPGGQNVNKAAAACQALRLGRAERLAGE